MEGTNQAVATVGQTSSPMPTSVAPSSASQPAMSVQSTYQASPQAAVQTQVPQHQAYQTAAVPQASVGTPAQAANPWQQAFQALSASLNTPSQSQAQVPYSAYQTPTPQANTQATWASQAPQMSAQQAQQTYSAPASTQAYSEQQVQQLLSSQQAQLVNQLQSQGQSASSPDAYLSQISDTSLEVLEHFGAEAPALLNQYSCAVEDALIEQVQRGNDMNLMLDAAGEERAAMNIMLTHPDILADYVNDFFGPQGPYPTLTQEEEAFVNQEAAREQFAQEIQAQEQRQVPANFQRPTMDMPTPAQRQGNGASSFWGDFSQLMDTNPENAWQYLAQAPNGALQGKMLIQDA